MKIRNSCPVRMTTDVHYLVDLRALNRPTGVSHTIGYLAFLQHLIVSWCMPYIRVMKVWMKIWRKADFSFEASWQVYFPLCPHWCHHPDFICCWSLQSCSAPSVCSCTYNWKDVQAIFHFFKSGVLKGDNITPFEKMIKSEWIPVMGC